MAQPISTEERILSATSENKALLATLAESDYATSALEQNNSYLKSLQADLTKHTAQLARLKNVLTKEQSEHEKLRDSTVRRFAYKIGGKKEKFEAKASKEEREYLDAVQAHFAASRQVEALKTSVAGAQKTHAELQAVLKTNVKAKADLDALYNSIFAGPTPAFPEEDAKEEPVRAAEAKFNEMQLRLSKETQAKDILLAAKTYLLRAVIAIKSALDASEYDIIGFGGGFADYQERSALAQAQACMVQVEMFVAQAQRTQPLIRSIGQTTIAHGNWISDVLFDNVFSDLAFHRKIEESMRQVNGVVDRMVDEVARAVHREEAVKKELSVAGRALEEGRKELMAFRGELFERVAGGLPAYAE